MTARTHLSLSPDDRDVVISICGVCPAGCGVEVHLADGKIDHLAPLRDHPQGGICPRGMAASEIVYSPDRLLFPMKRVGERGSGRFERIPWDQAYDGIVGGLKEIARKYGPQAVAIYTGRGNFEFGLNEAFAPEGTVESSASAVLFPFGSPNTTGVGSLCYVSYGMIASRACFGDYIRNMHEDLEGADLILVWGDNPATDSPPTNLRRIKGAQKRGARVIVIDHRRSETARATRLLGLRSRRALLLGALAALALLAAMGTGVSRLLYFLVPGLGQAGGFGRILCVYAFAVAGLAMLGADWMATRLARARSIPRCSEFVGAEMALSLVGVTTVLLALAVAGSARGAVLAPNPVLDPADAVRIQVQALAGNGADGAGIALTFRFASPDNRRQTGPLERFVAMGPRVAARGGVAVLRF